MNVVLIGGGEPGLQLLSWLSADPSTHVPLVIEPDRQALIHQVEMLGFRWSGASGPPRIRNSAEAMAEMAPPDLVIASIDDDVLLQRVRALLPASIPLLLPEDLAMCRRLHRILSVQRRPPAAPLDQSRDQGHDQSPHQTRDRQAGAGEDEETGSAEESIDQLDSFLERLLGNASWPLLLERMTWWMQWICGASQGVLFVYRGWGRRLLLEQARGLAVSAEGLAVSEWQRSLYLGVAQQAVDGQRIIRWTNDETAVTAVRGAPLRDPQNELSAGFFTAVPMVLDERPVGVIVLARPFVKNGEQRESRTTDGAGQGWSAFALSWLAIRLAGLLCRGMQMEWARESALRDRIRRGIKDIIGQELPAAEACRQGVELIAGQLSAASCRLYCRGPRASGWTACSSEPYSQVAWAPAEHPWRGTVMLTPASLEPLLLVQEPQRLLYLPFALGSQGDGVLVIEHPDAETWSVQLVELLKEMGLLLGTVAQRVGEE
jgi:hypothetical protein